MSLFGLLRTSTSGLNAQASRLATVSDNIANSNTTGYKRASTEFSSLILESGSSEYLSGSVEVHVQRAISEQGTFSFTTSVTDLAVQGNGFFLVSGTDGQTVLTRAGSFVTDGDGNLVNAAGFNLQGYSLANGSAAPVANGFAGLEVINIGDLALQANPSTEGTLFVNLPFDASIPADLPSANLGTSTFTGKTSIVTYGNLGEEVTLDVYSTKTATGTWEVTVFDRAQEAVGGGFPYGAGPLATTTLTFDPTTGALDGASPTSISVPIPGGATFDLDLSQSSQLAADYTVLDVAVDGNAPSEVDRIEISDTGVLFAVFENGARVATYQIPLATVVSPDKLTALAGNVFLPSIDSGDVQIGFAGEGGFGTLVSGALEQSTVDLASELTTLIESQRNYQANSRVFQTGADLLNVLVNLQS